MRKDKVIPGRAGQMPGPLLPRSLLSNIGDDETGSTEKELRRERR